MDIFGVNLSWVTVTPKLVSWEDPEDCNAANGRNALGRRDSVSLKSRVVAVFGSLQSPLGHAFWNELLSSMERAINPLEEGMATHSSILAWIITWAEELGGIQSIGSHRVRYDWSDLAQAQTLPIAILPLRDLHHLWGKPYKTKRNIHFVEFWHQLQVYTTGWATSVIH